MVEKAKKTFNSLKEILQPIYFAVWLILVVASIIPQIYPIVFNPLVIEGARYSTFVLVSILGSYLLLRRSEKKTNRFKGTLSKTERKLDELDKKVESVIQRTDRMRSDFADLKTAQEKENQNLDEKIGRFNIEVSKLSALATENQRSLSDLGKRLGNLFFIKCPVCHRKIELNIPNTIISGIHEVDGPASEDTFRGTKELGVQCPQCGREFHIDIPHAELTKI